MRFLIMGCINTLVGYAIYLLLLTWVRYEFAYAAGYFAGIVVAYALSAMYVFRKQMRKQTALLFPLTYLLQFLISLGILRLCVEKAHIPHWLAYGIAVAATIPLTFLVSRWIMHRH